MANLDTIGGLHYEMMKRCYNEKSVAYKDYGAKGIKVCEEWHDREVFRKWCKDNGWNKSLRLNRIDGTKDYCPGNCYFGNISTKREDSYLQTQKKRSAYNRKKKEDANIKGLMNEDPLYDTFIAMHERCENKKHINYKNYGGKGIRVCEEWCRKGGFAMRYIIRDRETGRGEIEAFATIEEAKKKIEEYEEQDKADGTYEENFYEIYDTEKEEIIY